MIERVSGNILINTTVEYPNGLDHGTLGEDPFKALCSQSKAESVYSPSRPPIDHMNVHDIASALQRVGITPDTIALV
jgi:hypothetical protein